MIAAKNKTPRWKRGFVAGKVRVGKDGRGSVMSEGAIRTGPHA